MNATDTTGTDAIVLACAGEAVLGAAIVVGIVAGLVAMTSGEAELGVAAITFAGAGEAEVGAAAMRLGLLVR
ncbi:hypothetical protein WDJ51_01220 [Rathayibacter sp. YIM 133350]